MNKELKRLSIALGLLFCLVIVGFFANADPDGKGRDRRSVVRKDAPKLPVVDRNRIAAIEISEAASSIRLERAGEEWVLPKHARAPVVKARMDDLLRVLGGFERSAHVAYSAKDPASYGLDPAQARRLKLFDDRGTLLLDVVVGKEDVSGGEVVGERGTFLKPADADDVFSFPRSLPRQVRGTAAWWMEKQLFPGDQKAKNALVGTAERVTLEFADVPAAPAAVATTQPTDSRPEPDPVDAPRFRVVLEATETEVVTEPSGAAGPARDGTPPTESRKVEKRRTWRLVEPAADAAEAFAPAVEGVIRSVVFASCLDVAAGDATADGYGLETPSVAVDVAFADGTHRKLTVGARATPSEEPALRAQAARYAVASDATRVFRISDYAAQALRKKPADFRVPEAPKPIDASPPPISVPDEGAESRSGG